MSRITSSFSNASLTAAGLLLLLLLLAPVAQAQSSGSTPSRIEMAREAAGTTNPPKAAHALPGGELRLERSELLASFGQKVKVSLKVDRPTPDASLVVTLPKEWTQVPDSGLPFAKAPRAGKTANGRAAFRRNGRQVELRIAGGKAGDVASFEVQDVGIVPGTYALGYSWRVGGKERKAGTADVTFYAPERESPEEEAPENPWSKLAVPGIAQSGSSNSDENSEVFLATTPGNPDRIVIGANDNTSGGNGDNERTVWITSNGGKRWRSLVMPYSTDAYGNDSVEYQDACCDPAWAADDQGNFWYSLITYATDPQRYIDGPSRILVNRIGAGSEQFQDYSTGLQARTTGMQDKQMMTVDNTPTSPTYGRVFVVWNEPLPTGGKLNVISHCDTFAPASATDATKIRRAERCDIAENWTRPAPIGDGGGNDTAEIYVDVAVGKTGKVYVTWLDYSSRNAVLGSVCDPGTAPKLSPAPDRCSAQTGAYWNGGSGYSASNFKTIATLDKTENRPIPFFCAMMGAPRGRVGAVPSVEVDRSGLTDTDRVYVAWGDLQARSGTTKCSLNPTTFRPNPPQPTDLTWESYVGSLDAGRLPGGPGMTSPQAGRTVLPSASKSDEFLPWLSVDQITGQAWVNFYSTTGDPDRYQTNHYVRGTARNRMGRMFKVSQFPSNYGGTASTLNDYGDYQGMDATAGRAYPVWTDNSSGDGEATTFVSEPARPREGGQLSQLTGADACISKATGDCTTLGRGLGAPSDVAVAPDGKHVYTTSASNSPDEGTLSVFVRNANGGLTQLAGTAGCHSQTGTNGTCTNGKVLQNPTNVVIPADGKHVYALSDSYPTGIAAFSRNATTGALTPLTGTARCITSDGTDYNDGHDGNYNYPIVCGKARKIGNLSQLTVSPDGKFVYGLDESGYSGAITVFSRDTTTGRLTQLAGTAGCMTSDGEDDNYDSYTCKAVPALTDNGAIRMAISADGKSAYVTGQYDLLVFSRSPTTGALTNLTTGGCLNENGERGCLDMAGVRYPTHVVVSPDGKNVYSASEYDATVAIFKRDPTTYRLSQPKSRPKCLVENTSSTTFPECIHALTMVDPLDMVISKDGGTIHMAYGRGVKQLDRDPATGTLSELPNPASCISEDTRLTSSYGELNVCSDAKGLDGNYGYIDVLGIALSPDDKFLYAASQYGQSIINFSRRPTTGIPVCTTNRQTVAMNVARKIKLLCKDDLGNPVTLSIAAAPGLGTLGTIDQANQTVTYTPPADASGETSFTYKATDATGASAPATVYLSVAK